MDRRQHFNSSQCCILYLIILEIGTLIALITVTGWYHQDLLAYLTAEDRPTLSGQLSNIYLLVIELLVCNILGILLWRRLCPMESFMELSNVLIAWSVFCVLISFCGLFTIWFLYTSIPGLDGMAATSLFQGMDLYFSDPAWKLLWDGIQYNNECCGVYGYMDWKEALWMPEEEEKCQQTSDLPAPILLPYVCCKRSVASCFQTYTPLTAIPTTPYLNTSDINTEGCIGRFSVLIRRLLKIVIVLALVAFVLQFLIMMAVLYFITKVRRFIYGGGDCESGEQRPLVVKYRKNVKRVTVSEDENFDEMESGEIEHRCGQPIVLRQQQCSTQCNPNKDRRHDIFIH